MDDWILLSPPDMSGEEQQFIKEAFQKNYIAPVGENLNFFERELAEYVGSKYAVAVNSGTAGLHLALLALNVGVGDTVFCSDFTFSASANPILYVGASMVLIDSEELSWNMDPKLLETAIIDCLNNGGKPAAVIVAHIYGNSADIDQILRIAKKYNIRVIEDACESLGTKNKFGMSGAAGDIGVYSFNGNKIITTSSGGAIVTDSSEYAENILYLSTQAKTNAPYYLHEELGYNYRMSNVLAGIGRGQLLSIESKIDNTEENYQFYLHELGEIDGIKMSPSRVFDVRPNRWLNAVLFKKKNPLDIMNRLKEHKIESRLLWNPLHKQPYLKKESVAFLKNENNEVAISEQLFRQGLCLPSGSNLTQHERKYVVDTVKNCMLSE